MHKKSVLYDRTKKIRKTSGDFSDAKKIIFKLLQKHKKKYKEKKFLPLNHYFFPSFFNKKPEQKKLFSS